MAPNPSRASRRVAAGAALVAAAAFIVPLALPWDPGHGPRASALAVGDTYAGARIVALRWTADRSRVVAVLHRGPRSSAFVIAPDGSRRRIAAPILGELDVYPAPSGSRVATVRTRANGRAHIVVLDARAGGEIWYRWAPGPTEVRWAADGDAALLVGAADCRLVRGSDGGTVEERPAPCG